MTFAELAQKILGEATTPDPRGLKTSSVGRSDFNPQLPEYKRIHPTDRPGAGGTQSKRSLINIFRLLRNDHKLAGEVNDILTSYATKRKTISGDDENTIKYNIANIDDASQKLGSYTKAINDHNEGKATLSDPVKIKRNIDVLQSKIKGWQEELKDILNKVEFYSEDNELLEQNLRKRLARVAQIAATDLLEKLKSQGETPTTQVSSLADIDKILTTDADLQQLASKEAVLKSLTEDSPENNVLLRYFDLLKNRYEDYKYNQKLSGPLATIELNKQFNRLPLSIFSMFYNSSVKDAPEIKLLAPTAGAKALASGFVGSQAGRSTVDKSLMELKKLVDRNFGSDDAGVLRRALELINNSSAGSATKQKLHDVIQRIIAGEEGSPKRLADIIYGNEGPVTESFDSLVSYYLTEAKKGARCTKVTGQQSSSRPSKKYMRCARVDGKLKRVHYGDPNLRIKKSNPKKRKSFRARHKCSSAKPGTAKYFSCKNW